ncbi:hypothetical protein [Reinekea sp. G2M2-21]|uniref:hypothetical protein n=1 Tax=Reinekea sp. G2M2-21 TaxID=2788942 RepID=UPI0018AADEF4|nr:hypothetical protein [Reinekea sp. G2M2-21]
MSRYKVRKLYEIVLSIIATAIGVVLLKYFKYPAWGVPFLCWGSFWCLYATIYFLFEYEEDDAGSSGLFNFNAGQVDSEKYRRIK